MKLGDEATAIRECSRLSFLVNSIFSAWSPCPFAWESREAAGLREAGRGSGGGWLSVRCTGKTAVERGRRWDAGRHGVQGVVLWLVSGSHRNVILLPLLLSPWDSCPGSLFW